MRTTQSLVQCSLYMHVDWESLTNPWPILAQLPCLTAAPHSFCLPRKYLVRNPMTCDSTTPTCAGATGAGYRITYFELFTSMGGPCKAPAAIREQYLMEYVPNSSLNWDLNSSRKLILPSTAKIQRVSTLADATYASEYVVPLAGHGQCLDIQTWDTHGAVVSTNT